jgi:hypothetical protein
MHLHKLTLLALLALPAGIANAQTDAPAKTARTRPAAMKPSAIVVEPGSEKWGDVPAAALVGTPSVELGGTLRLAVLQGDPTKAGGTYTLRLSCTDGLKIAPHWHPTAENVTVVKGAVGIGMGSKWDDGALKEIGTGGFASAPAQMRHFAQCKGDTILQVHGVGPFLVHFVSAGGTAASKKPN